MSALVQAQALALELALVPALVPALAQESAARQTTHYQHRFLLRRTVHQHRLQLTAQALVQKRVPVPVPVQAAGPAVRRREKRYYHRHQTRNPQQLLVVLLQAPLLALQSKARHWAIHRMLN